MAIISLLNSRRARHFEKQIRPHLSRYTYTDNSSNIAGESYNRNDIQAMLSYSF